MSLSVSQTHTHTRLPEKQFLEFILGIWHVVVGLVEETPEYRNMCAGPQMPLSGTITETKLFFSFPQITWSYASESTVIKFGPPEKYKSGWGIVPHWWTRPAWSVGPLVFMFVSHVSQICFESAYFAYHVEQHFRQFHYFSQQNHVVMVR